MPLSAPEAPPTNLRTWQEVHQHLFLRCRDRARQHIHQLEDRLGKDLAHRTLGMCDHALEHLAQFSEDKASRWLGFVQGMLVAAGAMRIQAERDYTRPLFHALKGPSPSQSVRP